MIKNVFFFSFVINLNFTFEIFIFFLIYQSLDFTWLTAPICSCQCHWAFKEIEPWWINYRSTKIIFFFYIYIYTTFHCVPIILQNIFGSVKMDLNKGFVAAFRKIILIIKCIISVVCRAFPCFCLRLLNMMLFID